MNISRILLCASLLASAAGLSGIAAAAPLNVGGARVFADTPTHVEEVQYRAGHYRRARMDAYTRERIIRNRFARMRVIEEPDGTILLPGISTGYGGVTVVTGAPRSRWVNPGPRIGVWAPRNRIGAWSPRGRITGGTPPMGRRH